MYYQNSQLYYLQNGTQAYANGDLTLATLEYHLFYNYPINLCGNWLYTDRYNYNQCPGDGAYHFSIFYRLPPQRDFTTWFSTGWMGKARLDIRTGPSNETSVIGSCDMFFDTYTSHNENDDSWKQLPSAMVVTIFLVATAIFLAMCICFLGLGCCTNYRVVTDEPPTTPAPKKKNVDNKYLTAYNTKSLYETNDRNTVTSMESKFEELLDPYEDPSLADPPTIRKMRWYYKR